MITRVNEMVAIPVEDMGRARRFYRDVLGFTVLLDGEGMVIFDSEALRLALHARSSPMPDPDADGVWLWLDVDEIDVARSNLQEKDVRFVGEKVFLGPGWEQPFLDSEGNVLRLWEPLRELKRSVLIDADPAAVFAALTDADAFEQWFAVIDDVVLDAEVGGGISFVDPSFGRVVGVIDEFVPDRRIAITFKSNWPRRLVFDLTPESAGTRVDVYQAGFDQIRDRDYRIHLEVEHLESAISELSSFVEVLTRAD